MKITIVSRKAPPRRLAQGLRPGQGKLNRRIATSASQLKHAQLSRWTLTCKGLNMMKQPWHTATDSINPTKTLKGSVILGWIKPRLIHDFGTSITLHRGPAR